ncbi:hypothetical protein [Photobacterium atrarenae]|uniref:Uncharacterized protein n=1 Tax=Photobacterium atrarenae TaxID=865757 RepID=A0ABY5GDD9_9GAMM|nr:hypothetical protein [Photobacterium atrarenae]UTV26876.1 hypothetical protein NNL38_11005 [Photobacterium atrarenae]
MKKYPSKPQKFKFYQNIATITNRYLSQQSYFFGFINQKAPYKLSIIDILYRDMASPTPKPTHHKNTSKTQQTLKINHLLKSLSVFFLKNQHWLDEVT